MSPLVIPSTGAPLAVWIFCAVQFAIIAFLLLATVARRDFWPFSHYPMFAGYQRASTARFFTLHFALPDGRRVGLPARAGQWVDEFDRAFAARWPDETAGKAAASEVVRRAWAQAAAFDSSLRQAHAASVHVRFAQIGAARGVGMTERVLLSVALASSGTR